MSRNRSMMIVLALVAAGGVTVLAKSNPASENSGPHGANVSLVLLGEHALVGANPASMATVRVWGAEDGSVDPIVHLSVYGPDPVTGMAGVAYSWGALSQCSVVPLKCSLSSGNPPLYAIQASTTVNLSPTGDGFEFNLIVE